MKDNKSHLTAITRKTLPRPTKWLIDRGYVLEDIGVLDYGCGRCATVNPAYWDNYDPYYVPDPPRQKEYRVIVCNYVLCTIKSRQERIRILRNIRKLLSKHGIAFVSVRNNKPKQGWGKSKTGTYQGRVKKLALRVLYENAQFRIYLLTKKDKLPY